MKLFEIKKCALVTFNKLISFYKQNKVESNKLKSEYLKSL